MQCGLVLGGNSTLNAANTNTVNISTNITSGTTTIGNSNALIGNVTLSGGTTLSAGTPGLTVTNPLTLAGPVNVSVTNNTGDLLLNVNMTLAGPISGPGQLVFGGTNTYVLGGVDTIPATTLTLSGNNSYTGGTTIAGGILIAASYSALGTGTITFSGGSLQVASSSLSLSNNINLSTNTTINTCSNTLALSGTIGGNGSLQLNGGGIVTISGNNNYSGGTNVNNTTLAVTNSSALGSGGITLANYATLQINAPNLSFGNLYINAFNYINTNGNNVTIQNIWPGASIASVLVKEGNGTLYIPGTLGAVDIGIFQGAAYFTCYEGGQTQYCQIINNSDFFFSSGTKIEFGSNATLTGNISISGDHTISVDPGQTVTITGRIQDGSQPGDLIVDGGGTLILDGIHTHTLGTSVTGNSTLEVDGTLTGSVIVSQGSTLQGTGLIGGITNSGIFMPGTPTATGTLTDTAALTLMPSSLYVTKLAPQGVNSMLTVAGAANLAGTLQLSTLGSGSFQTNKTYVLLTAAGGVSGNFSQVLGTRVYTPVLAYSTNAVDFTLQTNPLSSTISGRLTRNQAAALNSVDRVLTSNLAPQQFYSLFNIAPSALPSTLRSLTGEVSTGAAPVTMRALSGFQELMFDPSVRNSERQPLENAPALAFAGAPPQGKGVEAINTIAPVQTALALPQWNIWSAGFATTGTFAGNGSNGTSQLNGTTFGVAVGADYHVNPDLVVGFALGGGGTSYYIANGQGSANGRMIEVGIYGSQRFGATYVSGGLAYNSVPTTTSRTVLNTSTSTLTGNVAAEAFGGRLEGGHRVAFTELGLTPYAAIEVQGYHSNPYTETAAIGAPLYGLNYAALNTDLVRPELGLRLDTHYQVDSNTDLLGFGRIGWAHQFGGAAYANASFEGFQQYAFSVAGVRASLDVALVSLGLEWRLTSGFKVTAKADTELGAQNYAARGTVGVRYDW